jgi:hypothetical protein
VVAEVETREAHATSTGTDIPKYGHQPASREFAEMDQDDQRCRGWVNDLKSSKRDLKLPDGAWLP